MNYQRIYAAFIADRRTKEAALSASGLYVEKHHVLPRALGGGDEPVNIIRLTPEDHFFAHLLLAKIHGGAMWYGLMAMCVDRYGKRSADAGYLRRQRRSYDAARRGYADAVRERAARGEHHTQTDEWRNGKSLERKALAAAGLLKTQTPEGKAEMRAITNARIAAGQGPGQSAKSRASTAKRMTGHVVTPEMRAKISAGNKGKVVSAESRAKLSAALKGRVMTDEMRAFKAEVCRAQVWTDERREKVRQSNSTRAISADTKAKLSASHKARGAKTSAHATEFHKVKAAYAALYGVRHSKVTKAMAIAVGLLEA